MSQITTVDASGNGTTTTNNSNKYDRQLRLWGAAGQKALSETTVVLLRATAAGTETLKNLILPGIGSFLILDDQPDTKPNYSSNTDSDASDTNGIAAYSRTWAQEVSSNFFLPAAVVLGANSHGSNNNHNHPSTAASRSRGAVAVEYLQELNPDVRGFYYPIEMMESDYHMPTDCEQRWNLQAVINHHATVQSTCNLQRVIVIASDLEPIILQSVAKQCWQHHWPLCVVQAYGLIGIVRLQLNPSALVLRPNLRGTNPDLRLQQPFPALLQLYQDELQMDRDETWERMDSKQHGHVPYPFILLHALQKWKGTPPSSFAEKQTFQQQIRSMARQYDEELNFQEAVQNAYLAYTERSLHSTLQTLQQAMSGTNTGISPNPKISAIYEGLGRFVQHNPLGQPPLAGVVPDMTASTDLYIQLQQAYQTQATQDWEKLRAVIPDTRLITDDDITALAQNVYDITVVSTGPLMALPPTQHPSEIHEQQRESFQLVMMEEGEDHPEQVALVWFLAIWACQQFFQQYGRYPGTVDSEYEVDCHTMKILLQRLVVDQYQLSPSTGGTAASNESTDSHPSLGTSLPIRDIATEVTRYANAEIHTIASVVGGVASQEIIKVITGQYIPINNTYVYNGIASTAGVYIV